MKPIKQGLGLTLISIGMIVANIMVFVVWWLGVWFGYRMGGVLIAIVAMIPGIGQCVIVGLTAGKYGLVNLYTIALTVTAISFLTAHIGGKMVEPSTKDED